MAILEQGGKERGKKERRRNEMKCQAERGR